MNLSFNVTKQDCIAFTEQFYKDSPSYQRLRNRTRWIFPLFLIPVMLFFALQFGLTVPSTAVFLIGFVGWIWIAPKRFDARVRRYTEQQMRESSYEKLYGDYTIRINNDNLRSDGPTGQTDYKWNAVDRVATTDDYLFVFLSGPTGFPISKEQVGHEEAQLAYDKLRQLVSAAK
ncbi:YcxB family protein [Rhodopirellula sp. JC740]|uniref:YcxB family protein n=1 Tax=Rhodopirellula halodulae TaxID=2894198 RepID=A0ABS8NBP5_9BACT|nr:YcxB family protein [Rhodopirellula sp. JC740]MCC9640980.1 YcxB family protein [Rhodopirellula sp. JC740]